MEIHFCSCTLALCFYLGSEYFHGKQGTESINSTGKCGTASPFSLFGVTEGIRNCTNRCFCFRGKMSPGKISAFSLITFHSLFFFSALCTALRVVWFVLLGSSSAHLTSPFCPSFSPGACAVVVVAAIGWFNALLSVHTDLRTSSGKEPQNAHSTQLKIVYLDFQRGGDSAGTTVDDENYCVPDPRSATCRLTGVSRIPS